MLDVQHMVSRYGPVTALHDASFTLEGGEALALVGTNGAGKTTLVMSIAGHVIPESGRVILDNENITEIPSHIRARRGIGLVPRRTTCFSRPYR